MSVGTGVHVASLDPVGRDRARRDGLPQGWVLPERTAGKGEGDFGCNYNLEKREKSGRGADHRARRFIPHYPSVMYYLKVGAFCFGV